MDFERGVREVCEEALEFINERIDSEYLIAPSEINGYFHEIINILNESGDDLR